VIFFGLKSAIPEGVPAAWGARLIYPDIMLPDRQSWEGFDTPAGQVLKDWLNGGALRKALEQALKLVDSGQLDPQDSKQVTLFEDTNGIIVASPQKSFGYLYTAAWLKPERNT